MEPANLESEGPTVETTEGESVRQSKRQVSGKQAKKRNPKERRGRRGTRDTEAEGNNDGQIRQTDQARLPKRQCALMIAFRGSKYRGMQL
jgi:hypothetical protein